MFQSKHCNLPISANFIVCLDHGFYKFTSKIPCFVFYVEVYKSSGNFDLKLTMQLHFKGWTNI